MCVCVDTAATGVAEELSTVDGRNIAPVLVEGYVPSRSHFNIEACAFAPGSGGTNGQNLAPPRVLPNIESGGKGAGGNGSRTTDSYGGGARFCPSTVSYTPCLHVGFLGTQVG